MVGAGIDNTPPVHGDEAPGQPPTLHASEPLERPALALPGLDARMATVWLDDWTEHCPGLTIAGDHDAFAARGASDELRRVILQFAYPDTRGSHLRSSLHTPKRFAIPRHVATRPESRQAAWET